MTKVFLQTGLLGLSGGMDDWVYQRRKGKTVIGKRPTNTKEPSEAQLNHRKRFQKATKYAKKALANGQRAFYEAAAEKREKPAFALAVADYLNPPEVETISLGTYQGKPGGTIQVSASDDFGVVNVRVTIHDAASNIVETGDAVESIEEADLWIYTSQASVDFGSDLIIYAVATDRPGGEGSGSLNITTAR